ncbi:hypothetical protein GF325_05855 [Candidatus Bathyarchaeota archaeon]|nr:hypothetical protein [Candidatus Bathyarchaeota archaeon]
MHPLKDEFQQFSKPRNASFEPGDEFETKKALLDSSRDLIHLIGIATIHLGLHGSRDLVNNLRPRINFPLLVVETSSLAIMETSSTTI